MNTTDMHLRETCAGKLYKFVESNFDASSCKFLYRLVFSVYREVFSARNLYKKTLYKKLCQTCKFVVQVDLYQFLERMSTVLFRLCPENGIRRCLFSIAECTASVSYIACILCE